MRNLTSLTALLLLTSACMPHGPYVLGPDAKEGEERTYQGTVLSVEKDGDFLMEVKGRLLFVDYDAEEDEAVEPGDRLTVTGTIDNDMDEAEAPELDATLIEDWQ
jgi:hypothetical protein